MTTNNGLSYASLKSVLQSMDPNLRFQLSSRAPSIKSAEKSTPLNIHTLWLSPNAFSINNTSYKVEAHQQFSIHKVSEAFKQMEKLFLAVIEHKSDDVEVDDELTPGDVLIQAADEEIRTARARRSRVEFSLGYLLKKYMLECQLEKLKQNEQKSAYSEEVHSFIYLKLSTTSPNGVARFENVARNKKISEAMKYLISNRFGNRRPAIRVKYLRIDHVGGVLRLPAGLNLKVQGLQIGHNITSVMNSLEPLLDNSSYPLKILYINGERISEETKDYKHPDIQTAKVVCINDMSGNVQWVHTLLEMSNRRVHLECGKFSREAMITLINEWSRNGREVGTWFSFGMSKEEEVNLMLNLLRKRAGAAVDIFEESGSPNLLDIIILPMNSTSKICIYCVENSMNHRRRFSRWNLNIKVFAVDPVV